MANSRNPCIAKQIFCKLGYADSVRTKSEVRKGIRDAVPVAFGYIPLGMSYGMFAHSVGLPWWLASITAIVIYAGSMEFLAAGLLVAGAPLTTAAATALFVNSRHLVYGLSVPLEQIQNPLLRTYAIHALTDELYAVATALPKHELTGPRLVAIAVSAQFYWVSGTTIGALVATWLPFDLSFMWFAIVALFVILAINAAKKSGQWWLMFAGLALAVLAAVLVPQATMMVGLLAYCALAVAVVLMRRRKLEPRASDTTSGTISVPVVPSGSQEIISGDPVSGEKNEVAR